MQHPPSAVRANGLGAALALGLVVEMAMGGGPEVWLPDLLTGVVLAVAACAAWPERRGSAALLGVGVVVWFAGTAWPLLLSLHLGVLAHLVLRSPERRRTMAVAATVVAYVMALGMPLWRSDVVLLVFAVGLVSVAALVAQGPALRVGAVLSAGLLAGVALRTVLPDGQGADLALLLHQLTVCFVALLVVSLGRRPAVAAVTDQVVELGEASSLREALASTLADPSLEVGYAIADGGYVDHLGKVIHVPASGEGSRHVTFVRREGSPFAVLVHDPATLDDPGLLAAVTAATRLSGAHDQLLAALTTQLAQLDISRRRLVLAADEAQSQLELRLRNGAELRLRELEQLLDAADAAALQPGPQVARARAELSVAVDELRSLAQGLRPRELDNGLHAALRALARRSPLAVEVRGADERYDPEIETTAWFVCGEAVANAAKHAGAEHVRIGIARLDDILTLVVEDDGRGGADASRGTGLRGLADRVESLHGRCIVVSPRSGGTRLTVELPLDRQPVASP